jgi:ABC-type oligopeptide transport system ATPase subunit
MAEPILEARGLRKVFRVRRADGLEREIVALDNVDFSVALGGSLAIVGESGSGKTTAVRILVGLETATAGGVFYRGELRRPGRSRAEHKARARQIQMVFQDPYSSLDPRQTGSAGLDELLRVHFDLASPARRARAFELGHQVGLSDGELGVVPDRLSGGQRQRLAIARALATEPDVLVLDEAVSALDVSVQAQILNLLADVRDATGISYIFVSHDLAVVRQVSDHTIVMRRGEVVESGPTTTILDAPAHPYTKLLRDSVPRPGWRPQPVDHEVSAT